MYTCQSVPSGWIGVGNQFKLCFSLSSVSLYVTFSYDGGIHLQNAPASTEPISFKTPWGRNLRRGISQLPAQLREMPQALCSLCAAFPSLWISELWLWLSLTTSVCPQVSNFPSLASAFPRPTLIATLVASPVSNHVNGCLHPMKPWSLNTSSNLLFGYCQPHPRPQMAIRSSEYPEIGGVQPTSNWWRNRSPWSEWAGLVMNSHPLIFVLWSCCQAGLLPAFREGILCWMNY